MCFHRSESILRCLWGLAYFTEHGDFYGSVALQLVRSPSSRLSSIPCLRVPHVLYPVLGQGHLCRAIVQLTWTVLLEASTYRKLRSRTDSFCVDLFPGAEWPGHMRSVSDLLSLCSVFLTDGLVHTCPAVGWGTFSPHPRQHVGFWFCMLAILSREPQCGLHVHSDFILNKVSCPLTVS